MDYTLSNSYDTDAGTGNRMHEDSKAVPTVVSDIDMNSLIWSTMEIVKAAGLPGIQFDKANPASYGQVLKALRRLFGSRVRVITAGATTLTLDDAGLLLIDSSGGNTTITLPSAAGLSAGFGSAITLIRADGTGNTVTVLPAAGQAFQPGNLAPAQLAANPCRLLTMERLDLWSDGFSNWWGGYVGAPRVLSGFAVGTTAWVCPPFKTVLKTRVWGGGGGGGSATTAAAGGSGGGGGGAAEGVFNVSPGASYNVVRGNFGAGAVGATNGGAGGASSVGGFLSATGGGGGFYSAGGTQSNVGSAGSGSGGYLSIQGQSGGASTNAGGTYIAGSGGGTFGASASTGAGVRPGSGGAGGSNNNPGSNGAAGEVVLEF